jgi:hypothetical protein
MHLLKSENGGRGFRSVTDFLESEKGGRASPNVQEAISEYLYEYGIHNRDEFADRVRKTFDESLRHYDRVAFRNAIAECWSLNMDDPNSRDELYRRVARERGLDRKTGVKWKTGQVDPPPDELKLLLYEIAHRGLRLPTLDDPTAPLRMGVARTLTYVRVLPAQQLRDLRDSAEIHAQGLNVLRRLPDANSVPADRMVECWKMLKRHAHYRNHKGELNQHALDQVRDDFGDCLWIGPEGVGDLKFKIDTATFETESRLWLWPWAIFKYSTTENTHSTNSGARNPYRWIWSAQYTRYAELWRRSNETG